MSWNNNGYSNIQNSPLYTTRSGAFDAGSFFGQASYGFLWSGTAVSGTNTYALYYESSRVFPADYNPRQRGFSVRCITRRFSVIIQKKNQDMRLFFFSSWFLSLGLSFPKESPITFNFLLVQYGIAVNYVEYSTDATWATSGYNNVQNNPLYIPRSGFFNGGSFGWQASRGDLWSGTTYSGTNAYYLYYGSSDVYPAFAYNRQWGLPVRCITR